MAGTATKKEVSVADKLDALYQLQKIDSEIDRIRTIRGELPLEVQDLEDELQGLETRLNKLQDEVKTLEQEALDRKNAMKDSETAILKYKEQQNNVRNNREYESLDKEIEFQELEIKLHEKRIKEAKFNTSNKAELLNDAKVRFDLRAGDLATKKAELDEIIAETQKDEEVLVTKSEKAKNAIDNGYFKKGILPIEITETYLNENNKKATRNFTVDTDEGVRADTTLEALAKLKPAFAMKGSVTAGNSSQTSDGASFVVVMSDRLMQSLGLKPIGRLVNCAVAGVHPRIMGIGPIEAVPKVLKQAGMNLDQIDLFELNEAFASQALAVIRTLELDQNKVNINGGAIALGHPLGCTGSKLTVQIINDLERLNKRYGIVTACVGGGQGVAGIIEKL
jgi:acetyl-CoA acetyltransferase family protein